MSNNYTAAPAVPTSRFLALLPAEDRKALMPLLHPVNCVSKQTIAKRREPYPAIYFPCNCVFSVLALLSDGVAVEIGTIGNEGFVGLEVLLGNPEATDAIVCQVAGTALAMNVDDFIAATTNDTPFRRLTHRYLQAYISQVSQSVACNRRHTIEERFARWLLLTHDRAEVDSFAITQEFLADMLGVHRPSVSLVASSFQQAGLIRYSRGNMTILNREGLESISCECYGTVRDQFKRLLNIECG